MRELTRNITRRIGSVVATMTPEGLVLRKFRRRSAKTAKLISWDALLALVGADPPSGRIAAFAKPRPRGWLPKGGDRVYLNPDRTGYSRGTVLSMIEATPEPWFVIKAGRKGKTQTLSLSDLRPAPGNSDIGTEDSPLLESVSSGNP